MRAGFLTLIIPGRKLVFHLRHEGQHFINRGAKPDTQSVETGLEELLTVPPPRAKHVVGIQERCIIEKYFSVGVQTLEDQLEVFVVEQHRSDIESSLIFPISLSNPLLPLLIIAPERIVD